MFFDEKRQIFLDFLRNLTPANIVITFTIIIGKKLEKTNPIQDLDSFLIFALFLSSLIVSLGALYANITLFIEKSTELTNLNEAALARAETIEAKRKSSSKINRAARIIWNSNNKTKLANLMLALTIATIGITASYIAAIEIALHSSFFNK